MKLPVGTIEQQVKEDFDDVWKSYDHKRLEVPEKQREIFRSAHKYAVCLSLMSKAIGHRDECKWIFFKEASSDAIHLVHALILGDGRGAYFYLRSIIENFWRHHFFSDHPVEYGWLHTRSKYHMTMSGLREYCSWLDCFAGDLRGALRNLDREYAELSTEVHSTSSRTLVLSETLDQITLSVEQGKRLAKRLREVMKDVIVLSIFSSREVFDGLHVNSQAFILSCLDAKRRRWRQADL